MHTCYSALHYRNHMVYRRRIPDYEDTFESYAHALEKMKKKNVSDFKFKAIKSFMYIAVRSSMGRGRGLELCLNKGCITAPPALFSSFDMNRP